MTPRDRKKIKAEWNKRHKSAEAIASHLDRAGSTVSYDLVRIKGKTYEVMAMLTEPYQQRLQKQLIKKQTNGTR